MGRNYFERKYLKEERIIFKTVAQPAHAKHNQSVTISEFQYFIITKNTP